MNLFKSALRNIGVVLVGLGIASIGAYLDSLLGVRSFHSVIAIVAAVPLLLAGFLLRVWATLLFYERGMKVISLKPQKALITSGPYRFSRNPLYLGSVFIFFGAALLMGSPSAVVITALHLPLVALGVRREERQLEKDFGEDWARYKNQVRRWV